MLHLNRLERVVILNLHKNKYKKTTLYPAPELYPPPPPQHNRQPVNCIGTLSVGLDSPAFFIAAQDYTGNIIQTTHAHTHNRRDRQI